MGPGRTCQYLKSLYTCRCDTFIDTIIKDVFWTGQKFGGGEQAHPPSKLGGAMVTPPTPVVYA